MSYSAMRLVSILCFSLFSVGLFSQNSFKLSSTQIKETIDDDISNSGQSFQFKAQMINEDGEEFTIFWKILKIDHPEKWVVAISDLLNDYILNDFNDNTKPLDLMFNADVLEAPFNLNIFPRSEPGCLGLSIGFYNKETDELLDSISYAISINESNCSFSTSIENIAIGDEVVFFPNPVDDVFLYRSKYKLTDVKIVDMVGQTVSIHNSHNYETINVAHLNAGQYVLISRLSNGQEVQSIFIKQ